MTRAGMSFWASAMSQSVPSLGCTFSCRMGVSGLPGLLISSSLVAVCGLSALNRPAEVAAQRVLPAIASARISTLGNRSSPFISSRAGPGEPLADTKCTRLAVRRWAKSLLKNHFASMAL